MKNVSLDREAWWRWRLVVVENGNVVEEQRVFGPTWRVTRVARRKAGVPLRRR